VDEIMADYEDQGLETAEARGHSMRRDYSDPFYNSPTRAVYTCEFCGATLIILGRPASNQTNIMGDAVAVDCP